MVVLKTTRMIFPRSYPKSKTMVVTSITTITISGLGLMLDVAITYYSSRIPVNEIWETMTIAYFPISIIIFWKEFTRFSCSRDKNSPTWSLFETSKLKDTKKKVFIKGEYREVTSIIELSQGWKIILLIVCRHSLLLSSRECLIKLTRNHQS